MIKNKRYCLLLITGLMIALVINSCKKSNQSPIESLFTGGTWQLTSVLQFNYTGNTLLSVDTLTDTCKQLFTFYSNNTCTYTNFDCITQTSPAAQWSLTANQLFLSTSLVVKDNSTAGSSMPFSYASIQNLGQFSLILQTGDIQPNFSLTKPRTITQYGFVRQKLANGSD